MRAWFIVLAMDLLAVPLAQAAVFPSCGPSGGGTKVTIDGRDAGATPAVLFGAASATDVRVVGTDTLTATAPPGSVGAVSVYVVDLDSIQARIRSLAAGAAGFFTYAAAPTVSSVSPDRVQTTDVTLTLAGSGFDGSIRVTFNGHPGAVVEVVNAGTVRVRPPALPVGPVNITVAGCGGTAQCTGCLTVAQPATPIEMPSIARVDPSSGSSGGGQKVTIVGTGFDKDVRVSFGGVPARTVLRRSATELVAETPAASPGRVTVSVLNPSGAVANCQGCYSFEGAQPPPQPLIHMVTPSSGSTMGGDRVTVLGRSFDRSGRVQFNGRSAVILEVRGENEVLVGVPPGDAGPADVRFENRDGGATVCPRCFTYFGATTPTAPVVSRVSPGGGPRSGGTIVKIFGSGFAPDAQVSFGSVASPDVTVISDSEITAVAPASSASGLVDIMVINRDGQSAALLNSFSYTLALTVTAVTPLLHEDAVEPAAFTVSRSGDTTTDLLLAYAMSGSATEGIDYQSPLGVLFIPAGRQSATVPIAPIVDTAAEELETITLTLIADPTYQLGEPSAATMLLADGGELKGHFAQYLAEGATGPFFHTRFALANPDASAAAVTMIFQRTDGTNLEHRVDVPALGQIVVEADAIEGLEAAEFATVVESDRVVTAERTMRWDSRGYGEHAGNSVLSPATTWYLAEGATHAGFQLFYLLQNPGAADADVEITYLLPSPRPPVVKRYSVSARRRFNVWVNLEAPALANAEISAIVRSLNGVGIIVERAMYLNTGGLEFGAGHESAGITAPSTSWFLAEGATGPYFDLFVLIANPNVSAADVRVSYLLPSGQTLTRTYTVEGRSRFNVWVDLEDPKLANTAVSMAVSSINGVPIIVERTMWWPGGAGAWHEAHNSPGATRTAPAWLVADGEVSEDGARRTYILIANTSTYSATVRVRILFQTSATVQRQFIVPPASRFNVDVGFEVPETLGHGFGVVVESIGEPVASLVVERATYSDAAGVPWAAGSAVLGTPLVQTGVGCAFATDSEPLAIPSAGGEFTLRLSAPDGCAWSSASTDSSWLAPVTTGAGRGAATVTYYAQPNTGASRVAALMLAGHPVRIAQAGLQPDMHWANGDANGDRRSDLVVWRPVNGTFYTCLSPVREACGEDAGVKWGEPGDVPVPGDYDGDGKADLAVFRPFSDPRESGKWYVWPDDRGVPWGAPGDLPVPADYDGDGRTDVAVWRPVTGEWFVLGQRSTAFGRRNDVPVPADYDGDGRADIAVFRPGNGRWYVKDHFEIQWGADGDVPVPADYDGDGRSGLAVWRPSTGTWYINDVAEPRDYAGQTGIQWGATADVPVPADYDGDGHAEIAVWRPSSGTWFINDTSPPTDYVGQPGIRWGAYGDVPLQRPPGLQSSR